MLSVAGKCDGKSFFPLEAINQHKNYKVIITFIEELNNAETDELKLRNFGTSQPSFDFWNNPAEDIYNDFLHKPKLD